MISDRFCFTVCTKNQDTGAGKISLFLQKNVFFSPMLVAEKRRKNQKKLKCQSVKHFLHVSPITTTAKNAKNAQIYHERYLNLGHVFLCTKRGKRVSPMVVRTQIGQN